MYEIQLKRTDLIFQRMNEDHISLFFIYFNMSCFQWNFRHETLANLYKQCYSRTLRPDTMSGFTLVKHLTQLLQKLDHMLKQTES